MLRLAVVSAFLLFVSQAPAQMFSHGIPAGATSPEPDGRQHGIPSNVQSPTPLPPGVHPPGAAFNFFHGPLHRFGNPHRKVIVPVPVFYPIYGYGDGGYPADPYVQQPNVQQPPTETASDPAQSDSSQTAAQEQANATDEDILRQAYLQGARDALRDSLSKDRDANRYGDHYLDSREQQNTRASVDKPTDKPAPAPSSAPAKADNEPSTVFIFKDGHQIETKNFAIMGETLYDFSGTGLKKVQLTDLDKDKTTKANDDRGITVKLP